MAARAPAGWQRAQAALQVESADDQPPCRSLTIPTPAHLARPCTARDGTTPQNFLEGSIRVPCLLAWPGRIRATARPPQPVDHCDLFMTFAATAGCDCAELAHMRRRPGPSCLPLLSESPGVAAAAARE